MYHMCHHYLLQGHFLFHVIYLFIHVYHILSLHLFQMQLVLTFQIVLSELTESTHSEIGKLTTPRDIILSKRVLVFPKNLYIIYVMIIHYTVASFFILYTHSYICVTFCNYMCDHRNWYSILIE